MQTKKKFLKNVNFMTRETVHCNCKVCRRGERDYNVLI